MFLLMVSKTFLKNKWKRRKLIFNRLLHDIEKNSFLKVAEATCVEIASEMKNWFRLKKCSMSMFSEIFSSYNQVLAALFRK